MRKGYHSYLIITCMFTWSFDIKQSDFPRQNDRKTDWAEDVFRGFAQTEGQ